MPAPYQLTSEHHVTALYPQHIEPFWKQSVISASLISDDNIELHYAYCLCPAARATIVISPGRTEGYLKYQELIYDLYHNGYSVFIIDHRGQGLSGRLIDHQHKGYVDDFQHYVDDFDHFYHHIVKVHANTPLCLLGHSMGATIATLYLEQHPDNFVAAAMSAPLYGFNSGKLPIAMVRPLTQLLIGWKILLGRSSDYFFGQQDHQQTPFGQNALTHCQARYQRFQQLYQEQPRLQLGGITFHWLSTTLRAIDRLFAHLERLKTPLLLLQACDDQVVSVAAQSRFYQQMQQRAQQSQCDLIAFEGAKHELFFESDPLRNQAISATLDFFAAALDQQKIKDGCLMTPDLRE